MRSVPPKTFSMHLCLVETAVRRVAPSFGLLTLDVSRNRERLPFAKLELGESPAPPYGSKYKEC
jgi:hypothetical protein